jgi:hypothetical protein
MADKKPPSEPKTRLSQEVWYALTEYAETLPGKQTLSNAIAHLLEENKRLNAEIDRLKSQEIVQVVKPQMSSYPESPPLVASESVSKAELAFASMF